MKHKEEHHAPKPEAPKKPPAIVAGPWLDAKRGETWVDSSGAEHFIIGVTDGGFDSVSKGVVSNFRWPGVSKDVLASVSAWTRKV